MRLFVGIDVMSCMHPLMHSNNEADQGILDKLVVPGWCRKMVSPYLWLPQLTEKPDSIVPVFLLDEKTEDHKYWRHHSFAGYKSGRKEKADQLRYLVGACMSTIRGAGYPVLSAPGFEADDWAGELVRSLGKDDRAMLLSVDGDWGQLVGDRVIWLDTYCATRRTQTDRKSRVLDHGTVIRRFNSYPNNAKYPINMPRQIVDLKHTLGDRPDSIPAGRSVSRGIIDLLYPDVYPTPISLDDVWQQAANPVANLNSIGYDVPMYFLGLPEYHEYRVDPVTMTTLKVAPTDC